MVAPGAVFKLAFVIVIGIIAVRLLLGKDTWRIADDLPHHPLVRGFGFLVGLSAALTGVSGGSLCTMVLMLYGKSIHSAVATSAGLIVPITIAGTLGYMLAGLPVLIGGMLTLMNPGYLRSFIQPMGPWTLLPILAVAGVIVGHLTIQKIVDIEV